MMPAENTDTHWHDVRVPVCEGMRDTRIGTFAKYETTSLAQIFWMGPQAREKSQGQAFIASTYREHDARSAEAQRAHGRFVCLTLDIDEGDHDGDLIEETLRNLIGEAEFLLYSSPHSCPGDRRWRAIVPLLAEVSFDQWHDAQIALFDHFSAAGIEVDRAMATANRIVYLPNVPSVHGKTGEPLRDDDDDPLYYESRRSAGIGPGLSLHSNPICEAIAAVRERREAEEQLRRRCAAEAARKAAQRLAKRIRTGQGSLIDDFNASTAIVDLLQRHGYEQDPHSKRDWRSRYQTSGSFATRVTDDGSAWISLSGSDASAGIGRAFAEGRRGDAFDLFVHYEFGDDRTAALRELGRQRDAANWNVPDDAPPIDAQDPGWTSEPEGPSVDEDDAGRTHERGDVEDFTTTTNTLGRERYIEKDLRSRSRSPGVKLSDFYAFLPMHNYIYLPTGETWPAASVNSNIPPIPFRNRNGELAKRKNGEAIEQPANQWLDQHRSVMQMTWAPGLPQIIEDKLVHDGGWVEKSGDRIYNQYRPPLKLIGDPKKADPWIEHIRRVYPSEADHMIMWFAHRVQRPNEKINHAIVMGGEQGIGKDTILEPVKQAVGPWNCSEVSPKQMMERFNGFVKSVILRVSEARDLGDHERFGFYDHMKTYTAAPPDVLRVDEKHMREYSAFNVCGVIITTNHKTDGIYLPEDDRRHYVAWSCAHRSDFDESYWREMYQWYKSGGIGHVAAFLSTLDLSAFDPKAPPPRTEAFWEIVSVNKAPEDAEMADLLDGLAWPDAITVQRLADEAYSQGNVELSGWLKDRKNSRTIPHRLGECGYTSVHNDAVKDGLFKVSGKRCVIYGKQQLSIRERTLAAKNLVR